MAVLYLLNFWDAWTTNSGFYRDINGCRFWNDEADSDSDKVRLYRFFIASLWDHIGDIGLSECDQAED